MKSEKKNNKKRWDHYLFGVKCLCIFYLSSPMTAYCCTLENGAGQRIEFAYIFVDQFDKFDQFHGNLDVIQDLVKAEVKNVSGLKIFGKDIASVSGKIGITMNYIITKSEFDSRHGVAVRLAVDFNPARLYSVPMDRVVGKPVWRSTDRANELDDTRQIVAQITKRDLCGDSKDGG